MKTKNYHYRAMAAIAVCLMIFFSTAFPGRVLADDPPVKKFQAEQIYHYGSTSAWTYLHTYTYDCGVLETILIESPTANYELRTMTYDLNGNKYQELMQRWNANLLAWVNNKCTTNIYNGSLLTEELIENWSASTWVNYRKWNYEYDAEGLLISKIFSRYSAGNWTNMEKRSYTYDASGNCLTDMMQMWMSGAWVNNARGVSEYDANNILISVTSQNWIGGTWVTTIVSFYHYGTDGNYQSIMNQLASSGEWWTKVEYTYEPGHIVGQTYTWTNGEWVIGGMTGIRMELMVDGVKTVFPTQSGYKGEVFYSQELFVEPSPYQTVYLGYPPAGCAEVSAVASGGTPPYTYEWDNGESGESFLACPEESTTYTIVVRDDEGCEFKASTRVCVIDVRCGNKLDKVLVCHNVSFGHGGPNNQQTICIAKAAVPAHLAHGDQLGACGIDHSCTDELKSAPADVVALELEEDAFIKAYPNPVNQSAMVSYMVNQPEKVTIRLVNSMGQPVMTLFEGYAPAGEVQDIEVDMGKLQPGVYLLILQQADGSNVTQKIIMRR